MATVDTSDTHKNQQAMADRRTLPGVDIPPVPQQHYFYERHDPNFIPVSVPGVGWPQPLSPPIQQYTPVLISPPISPPLAPLNANYVSCLSPPRQIISPNRFSNSMLEDMYNMQYQYGMQSGQYGQVGSACGDIDPFTGQPYIPEEDNSLYNLSHMMQKHARMPHSRSTSPASPGISQTKPMKDTKSYTVRRKSSSKYSTGSRGRQNSGRSSAAYSSGDTQSPRSPAGAAMQKERSRQHSQQWTNAQPQANDFEEQQYGLRQQCQPSRSNSNSNGTDIYIVSAAMDRPQSLILQKSIAQHRAAGEHEKLQSMFYQFLPEILRLSRDQCANFVLQRLIENLEDKTLIDSIIERVRKDLIQMATNQYACRVLQSILTQCTKECRLKVLKYLMPDMEDLLQNNFGCYVIQKIIETVESEDLTELLEEYIVPRFFDLSVQQTGCRVMQDVFRYFSREQKAGLTDRILECVLELCQDEYGNYVVQKMLHYSQRDVRERVIKAILPHVVRLSTNKSGSNILEKCFSKCPEKLKDSLMKPIIEDEQTLSNIIRDKFGNYVIQKMLICLPYTQRQELVKALNNHFERFGNNFNEHETHVYNQVKQK